MSVPDLSSGDGEVDLRIIAKEVASIASCRDQGAAWLVNPAELRTNVPSWTPRPYNPCDPVALTRGTRLGPDEIVAALGAGGMGEMGEVYRATDVS